MTCETCPAQLTQGERRAGKRRCKDCVKAMPRIRAEQPRRTGGHAHVSAEWATPINSKQGKPHKAPPGVSWWLDAPRDGFTALAEAQPKRDTDKVRLQELTV